MKRGYVEFGSARIPVDVMMTQRERERGLRGRAGIASSYGMLFDFKMTVIPTMTMIGVAFPIDIVFIDDDGYATGVIERALPGTPHMQGPPSRWALELAPGVWAHAGAYVGAPVRIRF